MSAQNSVDSYIVHFSWFDAEVVNVYRKYVARIDRSDRFPILWVYKQRVRHYVLSLCDRFSHKFDKIIEFIKKSFVLRFDRFLLFTVQWTSTRSYRKFYMFFSGVGSFSVVCKEMITRWRSTPSRSFPTRIHKEIGPQCMIYYVTAP